jgi:hypothetical protein
MSDDKVMQPPPKFQALNQRSFGSITPCLTKQWCSPGSLRLTYQLAVKHRLAWVKHIPYERKRNCTIGEGKGPAFYASLSPLLPGRERANLLKRADDALVGQTGGFESGAVEGIGK